MGEFNKWNIVEFSNKDTDETAFEEVHKVVLDEIAANMAVLICEGNYGAISTNDVKTHGYYVVRFLCNPYTLQQDITVDGQVLQQGEQVVDACYLSSMQNNTHWYWEPERQPQLVKVCVRTIVHPMLDVVKPNNVTDLPRSLCSRQNASKVLRRKPVLLKEGDHDHILDEIQRRDLIEFEREISNESSDEE